MLGADTARLSRFTSSVMSNRLITASTGMMRSKATPNKRKSPKPEEPSPMAASSNPANRLSSPPGIKAQPLCLNPYDRLLHASVDAVFEELLHQLPACVSSPNSQVATSAQHLKPPTFSSLFQCCLRYLLALPPLIPSPHLHSMANLALSRLLHSKSFNSYLDCCTHPCHPLLLVLIGKFGMFCIAYGLWQGLAAEGKGQFGGMKDLRVKVDSMVCNIEKVVQRVQGELRAHPMAHADFPTQREVDSEVAGVIKILREGCEHASRTEKTAEKAFPGGLPRLFMEIMKKILTGKEFPASLRLLDIQNESRYTGNHSKIEDENRHMTSKSQSGKPKFEIKQTVAPAATVAKINDFFGRLETPPVDSNKQIGSIQPSQANLATIKAIKQSSVRREHSSSYDSSGEQRRIERRPATPSKQRKQSPAQKQIARNSNEKRALELIQLLQRKPVETNQGSKSLKKEPAPKPEKEKLTRERSITTKQRLPNGKFKKVEVQGSTSLKKTIKKEPAVALQLPMSTQHQKDEESSRPQRVSADQSKEVARMSEHVVSAKKETSEEIRAKLNKAIEDCFQSKPIKPIILADSASSGSDEEDEACVPDRVDRPDRRIEQMRSNAKPQERSSNEECVFLKPPLRHEKELAEGDDRPCSPEASPFPAAASLMKQRNQYAGDMSALRSERPGAATAPLRKKRQYVKNSDPSGIEHITKRLAVSRRKQRAGLDARCRHNRKAKDVLVHTYKQGVIDVLDEFRFSVTAKKSPCEMSLISQDKPELRKVTEQFKRVQDSECTQYKWPNATASDVIAGMQAIIEGRDSVKPTGMQKSVRDVVHGLRLSASKVSGKLLTMESRVSTDAPRGGLSQLLGRRIVFKTNTPSRNGSSAFTQKQKPSPNRASFLGKRSPMSAQPSPEVELKDVEFLSCIEGTLN